MRHDLESILVDCLRNTLNVMLCADSLKTMQSAERMIKHFPIFNLFIARSATGAAQLMQQVRSWNVMIIGPACSFDKECMELAAGHGRWLPIVTQTGEAGCCRPTGGTALIAADPILEDLADDPAFPAPNDQTATICSASGVRSLLSLIQMHGIQNRLLCSPPRGLARLAMEVLFHDNPLTVEEWASMVSVSPRKFQRELRGYSTLTPKKIIALYHAYRIAFDTLDDIRRPSASAIPLHAIEPQAKTRIMEYVLTRRSSLFASAV